jgi:hypothetical protein
MYLRVKSDFYAVKVMEKIDSSQVLALKELGYGQGCYAIDSMHKREMAIRTKDLRLVDKNTAGLVSSVAGGKLVNLGINEASEWAIRMEPIRNLKIYYILQRNSPEFEDEVLTFYDKAIKNIEIPIDDLYDFTRLCANVLVRVARSVLNR